MKQALIVFVKNIEPGKVKTRLAKSIGDVNATKVYHWLREYTKSVAQQSSADVFVFYNQFIEYNDNWGENLQKQMIQEGSDLGHRMYNAFHFIFNKCNYDSACIIGSDCSDITPDILHQAFNQLNEKDVVIGPAEDGGYYLLGMNQFLPSLFSAKQWSTEKVFEQTIQDIKQLNLQYKLLPVLNDIDYLEDLKKAGLTKLL